jgi:hypothetical protein
VTLDAPAVSGNNTLVLPTGNGSANQFLKNGATAGSLGWSSLVEDSSGRLGIATTAPQVPLDLIADASGYGIALRGRSADGLGPLRFTSNNYATIYSELISTASALAVNVNGSERARIDSSGRLLVGTSTAPTAGASTVAIQGNSGSATDGAVFNIQRGQAAASMSSGDNLGFIRFTDNAGNIFSEIKSQTDAASGANDYPGRLVFSTTADGAASPTERMRISNNGSVGIGVTDPAAGASATSGVAFRPSNNDVWFNHANGVGSGTVYTYFAYNSGSIGSISQSGTTGVSYNTSSDYRLKENVESITGAVDRILQLKPSRFNFIVDPDHTVDGFIAHEAQAIVPECVTGEKDAVDDDGNPVYQGIDQSKLVPLLTAALQEAIAKIETLEARLTALEATP